MTAYAPYSGYPYYVRHRGPNKMSVEDYCYRERSISLAKLSKRYYRKTISTKKYTETCRKLVLNTNVLIEEYRHALLVNKIKGVDNFYVRSLDGSEINLVNDH